MNWLNEYINCLNGQTCEELDVEKSFKIKEQNLPEKLYRFRPLYDDNKTFNKYEFDNLLNNKIWLSCPDVFNDPYDSKPLYSSENLFDLYMKDTQTRELLASGIKQIFPAETNPTNDDIYKAGVDIFKNNHEAPLLKMALEQCNFFRIGCFTENDFTNILMWSHYANKHEGYCLEYNIADLDINANFSRFMFPVIYSDKIFDISTHLHTMIKSALSQHEGTKKMHFNNLLFYSVVLFKSKDWLYEREWRLVMEKRLQRIENLLNAPIPTAIYLGSKIKDINKEEIIKTSQRLHIPIYQMVQKGDDYNLFPVLFSR